MAVSRLTVLVVGAGIFGVCAARELRLRGHAVRLLDQGPLTHPRAASCDVSKVVRPDYGGDRLYSLLMQEAIEGWHHWNEYFGETLYHETGCLFLSHQPFKPGGFEYESIELLTELGYSVGRLDAGSVAARHPAWHVRGYPAAYFNPNAGWVEAKKTLKLLIWEAMQNGVEIREGVRFHKLLADRGRVCGIVDAKGEAHRADLVVVAAGAWTPILLPQLQDVLKPSGQPVVHFKVDDPARFQPPAFPPWATDFSTTGWYGFPASDTGLLKIANHGPGRPVHPDGPLEVSGSEITAFRRFLHETIPGLERAPLMESRLYPHCHTGDNDFWIDHDPDRPGLMVAAGGSGHAFKFAPILGEIIADVAEHKPSRRTQRFRWRSTRTQSAYESAQHQ